MLCHNCGKEIEEKWTVCPYCGESLKQITEEDVQEKKRFHKKSIRKGVVLIIFVIVILFMCWSKDDNDGNTKNNSQLSYDFVTDAENGLLYSNTDGKITDKEGNVIPEFEYLTVLENGYISASGPEGEVAFEGVFAGAGGKIFVDSPSDADYEETDYEETEYGLSKLKKLASESGCARNVLTIEQTYGSYTQMENDGGYFDEVILGAWFDENAMPLAEYPPEPLWNAHTLFGLDRFNFIDGENYTFDMLKRSSPKELDTYAMILTNISKSTDSAGNSYFQGTDYITYETVIIKGNFNKLLNGDNVLVFAKYTGLASDDTPNFKGFYLEIINNRISE